MLALVNHGGGFEDPVVTIAASRRMPRFVARDVIWRVPGAAQVMRAVGAIPIHRRADSPTGGVDNHASFEAVTQALADGQLVAIFPEGESIDTPGVHQLRTGAARMALAAHTAGVRGVRIQPTACTTWTRAACAAALSSRSAWPCGSTTCSPSSAGSRPTQRASMPWFGH